MEWPRNIERRTACGDYLKRRAVAMREMLGMDDRLAGRAQPVHDRPETVGYSAITRPLASTLMAISTAPRIARPRHLPSGAGTRDLTFL